MLLFLTGGMDNPFTMLMVAPVTVSAATLPLRNTVALGLLALGAAALLVVVHEPLPWYPGVALELPLIYKLGAFAALCVSTTFIALYAWRLTKESRQMSAALTATDIVLAREQKLHALDGLAAAAAHELGTPLSTIVLVTKELEHTVKADSPLCDDIELLKHAGAALPRDPAEADAPPGRRGSDARARQRARHARGGGRALLLRARSPSTSRPRRRPRRPSPVGAKPRSSAGPASSTGSATSSRTPPSSPKRRSRSAPNGALPAWSSPSPTTVRASPSR